MTRISDLIEAEVAAAEAEAEDDFVDALLPDSVKVTRGHDRSKTLHIRLNEDEYRLLVKLADEAMVPTSTLARALLLDVVGN